MNKGVLDLNLIYEVLTPKQKVHYQLLCDKQEAELKLQKEVDMKQFQVIFAYLVPFLLCFYIILYCVDIIFGVFYGTCFCFICCLVMLTHMYFDIHKDKKK